jgi:hypothetical protein
VVNVRVTRAAGHIYCYVTAPNFSEYKILCSGMKYCPASKTLVNLKWNVGNHTPAFVALFSILHYFALKLEELHGFIVV